MVLGAACGYVFSALGTMQDRDSIYQYQPFTLLTLLFAIGMGNAFYYAYLHNRKKISYFKGLLNSIGWSIITVTILIGVMIIVKYLTENYQMDFSTLLGFPYHPR